MRSRSHKNGKRLRWDMYSLHPSDDDDDNILLDLASDSKNIRMDEAIYDRKMLLMINAIQ